MYWKISSLPRVTLFTHPTPLERLSRLSRALGVEVWVKRDDVMELALGGNKARKLEYILGHVMNQGYNTVITTGALHSNHTRLTAAAASRLGLEVHLVLYKHDPAIKPLVKGNILLEKLLGAQIHYTETRAEAEELASKLVEELRKRGKKPYFIPVGGANELGVLSYAEAVLEILEQAVNRGFKPRTIIHATGTCATQAGLVLGLKPLGAESVRVVGVSVGRARKEVLERCVELAESASRFIGVEIKLEPSDFEVLDNYTFGGYGVITREVVETMKYVARLEGLILDPVYTAKAMYALIDMARRGELEHPVLFIHTGGVPIVFQYDDVVAEYLD